MTNTNETNRARLIEIVRQCQQDRFHYFPRSAMELPWQNGELHIVLMGGQKNSFSYHLDLIEGLTKTNPGLKLLAVVDENPEAMPLRERVHSLGAATIDIKEFFGSLANYRHCVLVDRYCTWMPGIKYRSKLKDPSYCLLRWEQFLNAPQLKSPAAFYTEHSTNVVNNLDSFLKLERLWKDDLSRDVFYTTLSAYASLDFTWFAYHCGNHEQRYFPGDIGWNLTDNEVYVDCGALDGSECIIFSELVHHQFRKIHAFEPNPESYTVLCKKLAKHAITHELENIVPYPVGVSDRNAYLRFTGRDVTVTISDEAADSGPGLFVARLDDVISDMTYLKLEVEGAELAALRGARNLIKADRPKMAISTYHKPSDFHDLTSFLLNLDLGYEMQLRHQSLEAGVSCIYASVPTR